MLKLSYHKYPLFTQRLYHYIVLMRLHRPIGIWLLLWPVLITLWLAGEGRPPLLLVMVFCLGVVTMRSAGCVINDWADRCFDGHVQRTQDRPLVTGKVSANEALGLFGGLLILAFGLVLLTNTKTVLLSFGAGLLAALYPFMKRYTHFPQVFLGLAFYWSIPMVYAAMSLPLHVDCWGLYGAFILWAVAYDTLYAMVDREDDLKIGVKSTAIFFGHYDKIVVGLCHCLMLSLLILLGLKHHLGIFFYSGILCAFGLVFYQQWLIRERSSKACFTAFINNHWLGAALFTGLLFDAFLRN